MTSSFRVALVQMHVEPAELARNLARAEEMIARAAAGGAQVAVLPEVMDLGWTDPSCHDFATPIPDGHTCRTLAAAARRNEIYVCAGLAERDGTDGYNAAVIIDPRGKLLLQHRKLNELTIAHDCYAQGDRLGVCRTELGTLGLMICADGFAAGQTVARTLGYMGADIILSPSAWAVPANHDNELNPHSKLWLDNYVPVARDFRLWIVGVSNVGPVRRGPWAGWSCIGGSLVVGPEGQTALQGPYGADAEKILYVDVTTVPRPARGTGWAEYWAKEK